MHNALALMDGGAIIRKIDGFDQAQARILMVGAVSYGFFGWSDIACA
jgi:hypothetical protein